MTVDMYALARDTSPMASGNQPKGRAMDAFTATIILSDGSRHTFTAERKPKAWKSWAMRQMPYGTDFLGATFQSA